MTTAANNAQEQARAQYESIAAMLAAAACDFDQLEALRDERQTLRDELDDVLATHADPESVTELAEYIRCRDELADWDYDNAEELAELEEAAGEYESQDNAEQAIQDDPLSVEVRSDWTTPGEELEASEFCILLCTGGPAVRIVGELSDGEPCRAWMEYQDWGTPWTQYFDADSATLIEYARRFFYA